MCKNACRVLQKYSPLLPILQSFRPRSAVPMWKELSTDEQGLPSKRGKVVLVVVKGTSINSTNESKITDFEVCRSLSSDDDYARWSGWVLFHQV